MLKYLYSVCITSMLAYSTTVSATLLNIDEATFATGSDFAGVSDISNQNIGSPMAGISNIFGSLSGPCNGVFDGCNSPSADGQDSFLFTIDPGFELVGIFGETEGSGPTGLSIGFSLSVFEPSPSNLDFKVFPINTGAVVSDGVYGPGTYGLSVFGGSADTAGDFAASWSVALDVAAVSSPVPAPGSLILALSALGLLRMGRNASIKCQHDIFQIPNTCRGCRVDNFNFRVMPMVQG